MKLLVFGATGPTGLEVVTQALERGHAVTAFVRDPRRLGRLRDRVRVAVGDVTADAGAVEAAVQEQDAVVSSLGRRRSFRSDGLISRSLRLIAPAMERQGVSRLVLVSAFGVGDSRRDAPLLPRLMYRLLLRDIFADKLAAEDYLRATRLDWTVVYPVALTNGPRTGAYRVGERLALRGLPTISRADVAHFIVSQLDADRWWRKVAAISY